MRLVRAAASSRLGWILAAQVVVHSVGVGWGLPAADGWDNDGVAPRDFLAGIVATFTPGAYFRYPPVHLALLAVITSPATAVALIRARSLASADVVSEITAVPYMTFFSIVARVVTIAMAAGLVWALARMAEELRGKGAGLWTAALAGAGVPLAYYGQTSNLDVPALFWACLAIRLAVAAAARAEPSLLRKAALFAALAVGTKDQAYALFALSVPAGLAAFTLADRDTWRSGSAWKEVASAVAIGAALLLAVDGPLYNPRGFVARLRYLVGPASTPFATYSDDSMGRRAVVADVVHRAITSVAGPLVLFAGVGLLVVLLERRRAPRRFAAGLVPLLGIASFTFAFNCIARRADHRFVLPQVALLAVYGGIGIEALVARFRGHAWRRVALAAVLLAFVPAAFSVADVEANVLFDPRYAAEEWLRDHVTPGDPVETYGLNVYLPRIPRSARVDRVGTEPVSGRSPLPGVREVEARLSDAPRRGARYLVVAEAWAGRYVADPSAASSAGRVAARNELDAARDADACVFFRTLRDDPGRLRYHLAFTARWDRPFWPPLDIHASTARTVWIYEQD